MKGFSMAVATAVALSGCAASGSFVSSPARPTQARLTEQNRSLAETAPEVELNGVAGPDEVCRMQLVTGTRIPRWRCELMSPAEAALVEMQTDDEIEYAREQQLLVEGVVVDGATEQARASF